MFTARRREMATITTREPAYRKDGGIEVGPLSPPRTCPPRSSEAVRRTI
jgi:hypothetical protein